MFLPYLLFVGLLAVSCSEQKLANFSLDNHNEKSTDTNKTVAPKDNDQIGSSILEIFEDSGLGLWTMV